MRQLVSVMLIASTVRKERWMGYFVCFLRFTQSRTPVHGLVLSVFRVDLPASGNPV